MKKALILSLLILTTSVFALTPNEIKNLWAENKNLAGCSINKFMPLPGGKWFLTVNCNDKSGDHPITLAPSEIKDYSYCKTATGGLVKKGPCS